jgi:ABC-type oligopeptide transport system substrate-binding subunit
VTCNYPVCGEQARVLRRNLAAIGIDVQITSLSLDASFTRLARPGGWDIGYWNWFPDSGDPSDGIATFFENSDGNPGAYHDAAFERRIAAALRLRDLAARTRAFERLDADLTRKAALAPYAAAVTTDLFSDRIGCQVQQPLYGIVLGALCVRR